MQSRGWGPGCAHCYWGVLAAGGAREHIYVHAPTYTYTHSFMGVFVYDFLGRHAFTLMQGRHCRAQPVPNEGHPALGVRNLALIMSCVTSLSSSLPPHCMLPTPHPVWPLTSTGPPRCHPHRGTYLPSTSEQGLNSQGSFLNFYFIYLFLGFFFFFFWRRVDFAFHPLQKEKGRRAPLHF